MTLRLSALVKAAADAPTLPRSVDALDADTRARLDAFAARESLTIDAARTELRAAARVEEAVSTSLRRRRLGLVGELSIEPELDAATDAVVASVLDARTAANGVRA
ncbi:hypothetical protein [Agromyces mariniharenae]|uniref:Uncharacterized protein n=1 Tax=Agromyces mariniharenae TaxID=2604423 RepID=A0A5S4UZA2_9MICO|nr:hypothetical protein [Agromyces mariniharenae]TYL51039.1 hypothetical protein FYC51_18075 [Agromyces mariniharenae]